MSQIAHERSWKMGCLVRIGKGTGDATKRDLAFRWQAFGLALCQINHKCHLGLWHSRRVKQADKTRLNQARQLGRGAGKKPISIGPDQGLVIAHQIGTKSHHLQGQCRFSGPRWTKDQKSTAMNGDATGVQKQVRPDGAGHTGRPTTNRAPSGSEVGSALVGRMFSAQITPPWASTICFEIDRPRPELLPKWVAGRSE